MDWIWIFIPITALLIPIVAIFSSHQQKMAQIIHGRMDLQAIDAMRAEMNDLRMTVEQQARTIDALASSVRSLGAGTNESLRH